MMTSLLSYSRLLTQGEAQALQQLPFPLLVWEVPAGAPNEELLLRTQVMRVGMASPQLPAHNGEPLVFEVKKASHKANAFMMGVTVGRTENNDIVLDDHSVSRFHAYFQQDAKTARWKLVDAESKNGTWVAGKRLTANQGELLDDRQPVRFGDVDLRFYAPASFLELVRSYGKR